MFLKGGHKEKRRYRLPRVSGGVSIDIDYSKVDLESSPRERGCFRHFIFTVSFIDVFPA